MIATSSNVVGEIGSVATATFLSVAPIVYFIVGIVLAFFFAGILIDIIAQKKIDKRIETSLEILHDAEDL